MIKDIVFVILFGVLFIGGLALIFYGIASFIKKRIDKKRGKRG